MIIGVMEYILNTNQNLCGGGDDHFLLPAPRRLPAFFEKTWKLISCG